MHVTISLPARTTCPFVVSSVAGMLHVAQEAWTGDGVCINSRFLEGLSSSKAINAMCDWLEQHKCGRRTVNYKLRDWLFARQRYWGEPFPLFHDQEGKAVLVEESELPVLLPDLRDFRPVETGESPLSRCKEFMVYDKDGKRGTAGEQYDATVGGVVLVLFAFHRPAQHTTGMGLRKRNSIGCQLTFTSAGWNMRCCICFMHVFGIRCSSISVMSRPLNRFNGLVNQGTILGTNGEKMSKSRGNVISPDDVIAQWGADSLRLYEMFMGPLEATKPWQTNGIVGCQRFLKKVWRFFTTTEFTDDDKAMSMSIKRALHKLIRDVTDDTEKLRFNTAIAHMMEFMNVATKETHKLVRAPRWKNSYCCLPLMPRTSAKNCGNDWGTSSR